MPVYMCIHAIGCALVQIFVRQRHDRRRNEKEEVAKRKSTTFFVLYSRLVATQLLQSCGHRVQQEGISSWCSAAAAESCSGGTGGLSRAAPISAAQTTRQPPAGQPTGRQAKNKQNSPTKRPHLTCSKPVGRPFRNTVSRFAKILLQAARVTEVC